ncbi:zinc ribbon domain-containing protein [Slackia exigua]|uniref:zinc ribbon domain-containing protein n=1 Tax=Slackia exigua TaxID=84109 RepID=UPI0020029FA0|nr:zinc ribbon domain-containing protein [Slackia exigua]MCK6139396.1 helix-turn-helix domain-containing protein [Slackia exigua]
MALKDTLPKLRERAGLTQQQLADKLYVTRQAVSRWETGEATPGIDMTKLLAITLDAPITELLEMPPEGSFCQACGMYLTRDEDRAALPDGSFAEDWCHWCGNEGEHTRGMTMEDMIELCAPNMVESGAFATIDEAVSLLGAVLPNLKRWRDAPAGE